MCSDYLFPSFGWPFACPGPLVFLLVSRLPLCWAESEDSATWIQRICTSNSLSFFSSYVVSMFDVLHTVVNSVYVQTLPTEQATSVVTGFFSRGYDPYTLACYSRPQTIVGRTSLSVIIIITPRHWFFTFRSWPKPVRPSIFSGCAAVGKHLELCWKISVLQKVQQSKSWCPSVHKTVQLQFSSNTLSSQNCCKTCGAAPC